jgi:alginate O-acetyltransferase complex protein AlgI
LLFNSFAFFVFLGLLLPLYYRLRSVRAQNLLLVVSSYFFYGWWDWRFCGLLLLSTVVDFHAARAIASSNQPVTKKRWLRLSLACNLGVLAFFKYFNFFVDSFRSLLEMFGLAPDWVSLTIILPMGISFYTFQTLAYTIDVYRGAKPTEDFVVFSLYVAYFPQLVAGPIERAAHLLPQLSSPRKVNRQLVSQGWLLILTGLFRKTALADPAGTWANRCFSSPSDYNWLGLVAGLCLFSIQIYCDFAGYSEIARGTSKLLGVDLMVNFRQPYFSRSITEFWRRWHISLSTWLRDYVYIPLGGNRSGRFRTYANLMTTMLLGGLWHGANWTFVLWGALHGVYLAIHKFWLEERGESKKLTSSFPVQLLKMVATFCLVAVAWVFFRADSLQLGWAYLAGIVSFEGPLLGSYRGLVTEPLLSLAICAALLLVIDTPQAATGDHTIALKWKWPFRALYLLVLTSGICLFAGGNNVQFIYFQF